MLCLWKVLQNNDCISKYFKLKRYITFQFALTKDIYNILNISFIEIPGAKIELRLDQNIFPIFSPSIYSVSALLMHTYFWSLSNCNLRRQIYVGKMFSFFLVLRIKSTNRAQLRYIDNENIISISSGVKYIQYHPWYKSTSNCQYPGRKSLKGINSLIVGRHMKSHKWILTYFTSKMMSYLFTHRKKS